MRRVTEFSRRVSLVPRRALRTREAADAVHVLEVLEVACKENRTQNSALQVRAIRDVGVGGLGGG